MRKQYHLRQSEQGILAWDVDRLVEASRTFETLKIPLAEIKELDEPYWFNAGKKPTCLKIVEHMRLVEEADLKFPIILASDGGVMDGMHRAVKAVLRGLETINAKKFVLTPPSDFVGVDPNDLPY